MRKSGIVVAAGFFLAACAALSGCYDTKEEASRYPKIAIPGYVATDYYRFLFDDDNELIYNAICNLMDTAGAMGAALSDKKADKKAPDFVVTRLTYNRIVELLRSRDERIVSAALRFLQLFGPRYEKREELVAPILKVRGRAAQTRYEQLAALSAIVTKKSPVREAFLKRMLGDPSWLVSREAYGLVNSLENDRMRSMLIARYRAAGEEYEKLLILTALRTNFSGGVFKFLSAEALAAKNRKIRDLILPMLGEAHDSAECLRWVSENHAKLSPEAIAKISNSGALYTDFTSALYGTYIRDGWVPDNDFFGRLYENTLFADRGKDAKDLSAEDAKHIKNIRDLEKAVSGNTAAAEKWAAYKKNKEAFVRDVYGEIKAEYEDTVKQFTEKLGGILDKHQVDPEKKKEFFSGLSAAFIDEESFDKAVDLFKLMGPDQAPKGGAQK